MCDTFVALAPATADGAVVFAKNSDCPAGEAQSIRRYAAAAHPPGETVRCTYIEVPQAPRTLAVILSQIDWMWGAEMGANEAGVVIGNEAVWTHEPLGSPALLGMDLVRLGLERGETARAALDVIAALLEQFGQGGACAENDPGFAYHNAFLIADWREAWVLETAGRWWAAEQITAGTRNISNGLTIRERIDGAAEGLQAHARERGLWPGDRPFDFAAAFSATPAEPSPYSRQALGTQMLESEAGRIGPETMAGILADHDSGICMHGGFETTASMISVLRDPGNAEHWLTGRPYPCRSTFERVEFLSEPALT